MARDEFQDLPGIGPSLAADLRLLGVKSFRDLARRDPERLYARLCDITKAKQDPCVLYVFRCAVYAARTPLADPALLKWPAWAERRFGPGGRVVRTEKGVPERFRKSGKGFRAPRSPRSRGGSRRAADLTALREHPRGR